MIEKAKNKKTPLTDAERQKRFIETAKKVGASENIADFDNAFRRVVQTPIIKKDALKKR